MKRRIVLLSALRPPGVAKHRVKQQKPRGIFKSSLEGNVSRAIDLHEGDKLDKKMLNLGQETADAVDRRRGRTHIPLTGPVHHEAGLLLGGLDRNKAHVRPPQRLADCRRVGQVGLAALAAHATSIQDSLVLRKF